MKERKKEKKRKMKEAPHLPNKKQIQMKKQNSIMKEYSLPLANLRSRSNKN